MSLYQSLTTIRMVALCLAAALLGALAPQALMAGEYTISAHGSSAVGVARPAITNAGYSRGNCGHCHEMHASANGVEPDPASGTASPYVLFAESLDNGAPYSESDNFCFFCHNQVGSVQQQTNLDYSAAFGGAATLSQSIMASFNQTSNHNLGDIKTFVNNSSSFPWFNSYSNPCNACHNPHLAKRNWVSTETGFPLLSAISKPSSHSSLWGESQLMSAYTNSYEAPYSSGTSREPAGVGSADGGNTPDYAGFCTDCHDSTNTITSSSLGTLKKVDWATEKHGGLARDGGIDIREPYATASATKSGFVLSCLDCHEPHGSPNIMLLRRRINGEDLEGTITTTDAMSYVCKRCHKDDLAAGGGTGVANKWKYVHHESADRPYNPVTCTDCHGPLGGINDKTPIPCGNCHGHGMTDSWAGGNATGRKTF